MKPSTHFLFSFFLASSFVFSQAIAKEELPKGNETGNRLEPTEALVKMIDEEEIFTIDKEQLYCPAIVQLKKSDGEYLDKDKLEKGDIYFNLSGYKEYEYENKKIMTFDNFTHENNRFIFKPKLKGKSKNLGDGCSILAGIACRSDYQTTTKDSIVFEGSARVYSIAMIASMDSSVQINPEKKSISYLVKGNGTEDVLCNYGPASTEVKAKVLAYHANLEANRIKREESMKVNDTNRSAVKETEQRSPAGDSSATKTQSK